MLVCTPFAWIWMAPSQIEDFGRSLVAVSLFASNILFWRESNYFEPAAEEKPLLHTWSLAVEEQYYVFFPLFLLADVAVRPQSRVLYDRRDRRGQSAPLRMGLAQRRRSPTSTWHLRGPGSSSPARCALSRSSAKNRNANDVLAALGLGLIVFAILAFDAATPFPSLYALVPVGGTALIILFGASGTWTARLLSLRPIVGIGLISYSLYLWHQPLFAFARIYIPHKPSQATMLFSRRVVFRACVFFLAVHRKAVQKKATKAPAFETVDAPCVHRCATFVSGGRCCRACNGWFFCSEI